MRSIKLNIIFLLGAISVLSACGDDDNDLGPDSGQDCFVTKLTSTEGTAQSVTVLTYNSQDQITQFEIESEGLAGTVTYSGGQANRINLTESPFGPAHIEYTYNGSGQLTKFEVFSSFLPNSPVLRNSFEYNSTGQVNKITTHQSNFVTPTLNFSEYVTLTYDSRGNISQEKSYRGSTASNATLRETIDYTYDEKKNPLASLEKLQNGVSSPNNILTAVTKNSSGTVVPQESYAVVYTYNNSNYPTSAVQTTQSNEVSTVNAEYRCK